MSPGHAWLLVLFAIGAAAALAYQFAKNRREEGFDKIARAQALGSRVRARYSRGKNPSLTLSARVPNRGRFTVRLAGGADRLVEGLSLAGRVPIPDAPFSERFHVNAEDEKFAEAFFADAAKRRAVAAVFDAGFRELTWEDGQVEARWDGFSPSGEDPEFVGRASAALRALESDVPAAAHGAGKPRPRYGVPGLGTATTVAIAMIVFLVMMPNRLPGRFADPFQAFFDSLKWSLPIGAAVALWNLKDERGKSGFLDAAKLMAVGVAIWAVGLGYPLYAWVNAGFDRGEAKSYTLLIREKRLGRRSYDPRVVIQSWRPGEEDRTYEISFSEYDMIAPQLIRARVTVKPGFLGREWFSSMTFGPP